MNHKKNLREYAYSIVANYSKIEKTDGFSTLAVYDLPDNEREELCRLYTEAQDRDFDFISIASINNDYAIDNEYNCALLEMLENNTQESRDHFACIVLSNVKTYCDQGLQELIDDVCAEYDADLKDLGKYGDPDADTY